VGKFLRETELLDNYSEESCTEINTNFTPEGNESSIGFNNAVFAWSKDADDGTQTPSSRSYRLKVPGRVEFKPNALNLIVGPTCVQCTCEASSFGAETQHSGSGKTSMLMALLGTQFFFFCFWLSNWLIRTSGEMHFMPSGIDSWYNLPRGQGIAYAAQESWVQNETIRDNILFGTPYEEERYQKGLTTLFNLADTTDTALVLRQCALEQDLMLFEAGDKTEVGEKGLTLRYVIQIYK
jgi:hypothetical protein